MKKLLNIALILILAIGFIGCNNKPSISTQVKSIIIYENETFDLNKSYFQVKNSESDVNFAILDNEIAILNGLTIKPKKAGITYVRVSISDEVFIDVKLIVLDGVVAKDISFEKYNITLNLVTNLVAYNKIKSIEEITEIPTIEYNSNIIDYDYESGKITAKSVGVTTVKLKFIREEISFNVKVDDIVYIQSLFINDVEIKNGSSGVFDIIKVPSNGNAYSLWVRDADKDIIDVTPDGHYVAKKDGTATIFYNYKKDNTAVSQSTFVVNVVSSISEQLLTITDKNFSRVEKCFIDNEYYFVLNLPSHYVASKIIASDNIVVTKVEYVENRGFIGTFTFKSLGEQYISTTYEQDIHNAENNTTYKCRIEVTRGDSYTVRGKYDAYWIYPDDGGNFIVNLCGTIFDLQYLIFFVERDGVVIEQNYEVYNVTNGETLLIDRTFDIISEGIFNFKLIYEDRVIEFYVQVNDYR